jgi:hypothetical protein
MPRLMKIASPCQRDCRTSIRLTRFETQPLLWQRFLLVYRFWRGFSIAPFPRFFCESAEAGLVLLVNR